MTAGLRDTPRVVIFPPLAPLASVGAAVFGQWLCPLGFFAKLSTPARMGLGVMLCAAGAALLLGGLGALRKHRTNVSPSRSALALVQDGAFRVTRNPMYVGGSIVMLGSAFFFGLDWLPALTLVSVVALHFGVILPEETYLERVFGASYLSYKARTHRYLGL